MPLSLWDIAMEQTTERWFVMNRTKVAVEICYLEKKLAGAKALSPVQRKANGINAHWIHKLSCRIHNLKQELACSRIPSITVIGMGDVREQLAYSDSVQMGLVRPG